MNVIILAGGLGKRLHPITKDEYPKCMVIVNGKPFIEHLIDHISQFKISNIILSIGHKAEIIIEHFKDNKKILYSEESEPLGTSGAIRFALKWFSSLGETFVVINGDTIVDINLDKMMDAHEQYKCPITMAVKFVGDVSRFGSVIFDRNTLIREYIEKSEAMPGYINAGLYILQKKIWEILPKKGSFEKDFLQKSIVEVSAYDKCYDFIDIGIPEDYKKFVERMGG